MGREVYGSYTNVNDSLTAANKAIPTRELRSTTQRMAYRLSRT